MPRLAALATLTALLASGPLRAGDAVAATTVATTAASTATTATPAGDAAAPLRPIASLDLPRYMGRWHELARYPNRFQRQCTGPTTADYALLPDGGVQVTNRCGLANGSSDEAIGRARPVGAAGTAQLQVRFAPAWLGWLPQVWGDYWVVDLDAAYRVSIVSEPRREFLWVLSRTPALDAATWQQVETRLRALGFDPARLQRAGTP